MNGFWWNLFSSSDWDCNLYFALPSVDVLKLEFLWCLIVLFAACIGSSIVWLLNKWLDIDDVFLCSAVKSSSMIMALIGCDCLKVPPLKALFVLMFAE